MIDLEEVGVFFSDLLSEIGRKSVPVNYRFMRTRMLSFERPRQNAESRFYRSSNFRCFNYSKPISKCCNCDEDF